MHNRRNNEIVLFIRLPWKQTNKSSLSALSLSLLSERKPYVEKYSYAVIAASISRRKARSTAEQHPPQNIVPTTMGKKSKKKGGAANKAARKEKLQERREQQLEQLDQQHYSDGGNNELVDNRRDREYFVGDRVWFMGDESYCDMRNPNTYRGVVHAVDGDFVEIKPLQSLIDGGNYTERIPTKTKPPD
eukprot:scaffold3827_cov72-Skeletonema_dohrnii-CCMP3373.AAC.1